MRWIEAVLRSRAVGALLVGVLVFVGVKLGLDLWPVVTARLARLEPLAPPKTDGMEAAVRQQIDATTQRCLTVIRDSATTSRQKALAWADLGKTYLAFQFFENAVPCLRNAAKVDPVEFRWRYLEAWALDRAGRTPEAPPPMADAVKLMEKDVSATPADLFAALCFLGQAAMRLNRPADAQRTFEEALRVQPRSPFVQARLGQLMAQTGKDALAMTYLEQALREAPNQPAIRELLAAQYRRQGNAAKAAEYAIQPARGAGSSPFTYPDPLIQQVFEINQSASRLQSRGVQLLDNGHLREALTFFTRAAEANPGASRINLGITLLALGQVPDAQRIFEETLRREPANENARAALLLAYASSADTRRKATDEARAWRREQPASLLALRTLAEVSMKCRDFAGALAAYQDAIRLHVEDDWPVLGAVNALSTLGRYRAALGQLDQLHANKPDDPGATLLLARFLATCPDATFRDGKRSLALSRPLLSAGFTLVRAETVAVGLAEVGQFSEALQLQQKGVAACGPRPEGAACRRAGEVLQSLQARKPWREAAPLMSLD